MTISNVLVNDTVRIKVKFVDIDPTTGAQTDVSPASVNVIVKNSDNAVVASTNSPPSSSASQYYFDYTPTLPDQYQVVFTGNLTGGSSIVVSQQLYVSTPTSEYKPTITLRADESISFAPNIAPLYIDPEGIRSYFPDATLLEIGELVHGFSHEVNTIFGIRDPNLDPVSLIEEDAADPVDLLSKYGVNPYTVFEYIQASVLCRLTKIYGFGGDDELSLELADFKITNRNTPRSNINRANATTWCQIAAALRKEIVAKRVSARGIVPKGLPRKVTLPDNASLDPQTGALIYINDTTLYGPRDVYRQGSQAGSDPEDPMPDRNIRRYD